MSQLKYVATFVAAAALLPAGSGISAADGPIATTAERGMLVPMSEVLRRCDFTETIYTLSTATSAGSAVSIVSTTGSDVRADVSLTRATPDVRFFVRLVEYPPPTNLCRPGNPGVAAATIDTDGGGNGTVSLQEPVLPGATHAWVFMEGPPGDFYSSDILAPV